MDSIARALTNYFLIPSRCSALFYAPLRTPVASMALLYWIQFVITETSYIETYFRSHEVPVPLLLIEEVGSSPCVFGCFYSLLVLCCC